MVGELPQERLTSDERWDELAQRGDVVQSNKSLTGLDHRRDSYSFMRGFLWGLALGIPFWVALVFIILALIL